MLGQSVHVHCACSSLWSPGLATWWQTPFGSFGGAKFRDNDPIDLNNGTLRIPRATSSHTGLYQCHLVDNRGTTVIPYTVNVVERARPRMTRETEGSATQLVQGVVPSVVVTFLVAFTLGAFSSPYVIRCLQRTRARIGRKRERQNRPGDIGLFRMGANENPAMSEDSGAPTTSTPVKSPTKQLQPKDQCDGVQVEEADGMEDEADGAQDGGEEEGTQIPPKRRSRVIKLYNYDEEGKKYGHVTEPEEVVEEREPGPRHRVMSLTRLNTIMSQAETLDGPASRKESSSSVEVDDPPQIEPVTM
ncbi:hypothetical protein NFI96_030259 [Prochilodus magdalenae]|nr:hypothetical protein NFI96_030259 [Prochilodus magdalenae]